MYVTQQEMIAKVGEDALYVAADRDGDEVLDTGAIDSALASASAEIDSYLAVRYPLPLAVVPENVKDLCVWIALYKLSLNTPAMTDDLKDAYNDSISYLQRLSSGKAALDIPKETSRPPKPVVIAGPERQFTRDKLRGL